MHVLIIGGTRHMGHYLTLALQQSGHTVTVLNRGITRDDLPDDVARLRADRTIPAQLEQALSGHTFDAVVDFVLYDDEEAQIVVDLFRGKIDHYIYISSGQVYLLRTGINRPFSENHYDGECIIEPALNTYDHEEWLYGLNKRRAEDLLARAHETHGFPYTSLRLPMVNGERDPMNRLYNYILRMKDGGAVLVPDEPNYPLRHVYAHDVVRTVLKLLENGTGKGDAYNISQDETVTLVEFLNRLGNLLDIEPNIVEAPRSLLEANGFLPDCSPFSDRWMSELDNTRSKADLGMTYTPLDTYLQNLVDHYAANQPQQPISYRRRNAEKHFAENYVSS
ncbi:MAG: NAD-dependent epimerase/dehydratase family protein [Chloroflexota bacterium]